MKNRPKKSEAAMLAQWNIALTNAQTQPEIAKQTELFGYNAAKVAEGQQLYNQTMQVWQFNKQEDRETLDARKVFDDQYNALKALYIEHRKKAKAKFRNQPELLVKLKIQGENPQAYINFMQHIEQFYIAVDADNDIKTALLTYNITEEELSKAKELIKSTITARTEYTREIGESQDATKQKDAALGKLENWMRDFYAMAAIALKDSPQLLESVGIFRKS